MRTLLQDTLLSHRICRWFLQTMVKFNIRSLFFKCYFCFQWKSTITFHNHVLSGKPSDEHTLRVFTSHVHGKIVLHSGLNISAQPSNFLNLMVCIFITGLKRCPIISETCSVNLRNLLFFFFFLGDFFIYKFLQEIRERFSKSFKIIRLHWIIISVYGIHKQK